MFKRNTEIKFSCFLDRARLIKKGVEWEAEFQGSHRNATRPGA